MRISPDRGSSHGWQGKEVRVRPVSGCPRRSTSASCSGYKPNWVKTAGVGPHRKGTRVVVVLRSRDRRKEDASTGDRYLNRGRSAFAAYPPPSGNARSGTPAAVEHLPAAVKIVCHAAGTRGDESGAFCTPAYTGDFPVQQVPILERSWLKRHPPAQILASVSDSEHGARFSSPAGRPGCANETLPHGPGVDSPAGRTLLRRRDVVHRHPRISLARLEVQAHGTGQHDRPPPCPPSRTTRYSDPCSCPPTEPTGTSGTPRATDYVPEHAWS